MAQTPTLEQLNMFIDELKNKCVIEDKLECFVINDTIELAKNFSYIKHPHFTDIPTKFESFDDYKAFCRFLIKNHCKWS